MIHIVLPVIASTLSMIIGFIIGRCFADLESTFLVQELRATESENEKLGEALASATDTIENMQADLEDLAARYCKEAGDVAQEAN